LRVAGIVLARVAPVDRPTASLGMIAGGAFVLAVQALRLLVMVLAAPLVVRWLVRERGAPLPSAACSPRSTSSASPSRPSESSSR
jgi:uncharacterized membrane protein AbrB (regulator of aidB expression)